MVVSLEGKTIVITGASSGIGEAIALEYAKHKASLLLTARNLEQLQKVCAECKKLGASTAEAFSVDMAVSTNVKAFADGVLEKYGRVDVLVNNAGMLSMGNAQNGNPDEWEKMMRLNVDAPMRLTRAFAPKMVEKEDGTIINICSDAGVDPMSLISAYAATKFAVRGWSLSCYENLRAHNVKVLCINPSYVNTPMAAGFGLRSDRMIQPSDIAEVSMLPFRMSSGCCPQEVTLRLTRPCEPSK